MHSHIPLEPKDSLKLKKPPFLYGFRSDFLSFIHAVRFPTFLSAAGFLLCFSDCFSVPSPFSVVWLFVLAYSKKALMAPILGIVASSTMRLVWGLPLDIAQIIGCVIVSLFYKKTLGQSIVKCSLFIGLALLPRLILSLFSNELTFILLSLASVAIGIAAVPAFSLCVRALSTTGEAFKAEEKACVILIGALLLCGAGHLELFSVNLGLLFSFLAVLLTGYTLGASMGVIIGFVAGASLALSGFSSATIVQMALCGIASGITPKKEPRIAVCGLFVLGGMLSSLLTQTDQLVSVLIHVSLACVFFLPIKKQALVSFESLVMQVRPATKERENTYAAEMLKKWESAITSIAQALPMPSALTDDLEPEQQGRLLKASYERDMIITHLTAMAQAVKRLSTAAHGESLNDLKAAMEIEEALSTLSFPGRLLYARRIDGHLHAAIEAEVIGFNRVAPGRLIDMLFRQQKLCMELTNESRTKIELEEVPRFEATIGHAAISCQPTESAIGDAVLVERLPGGKMLIMLSDGMGHGPIASVESQKTLELLKMCLDAGYTREQAITAVNGMMLSATGGDRFATVDLWTVDLWTGACEVSKLGACQSYFIRNGKIKAVKGVALPLGILERVSPENSKLRLMDNDILVLMSDGVSDAYHDEELLKQQLSFSYSNEPQKMADAFLRTALICQGGVPKDDMSVLTVFIKATSFKELYN